jgi:hypothetical protein
MDTFRKRISPQVIRKTHLSANCGRELQARLCGASAIALRVRSRRVLRESCLAIYVAVQVGAPSLFATPVARFLRRSHQARIAGVAGFAGFEPTLGIQWCPHALTAPVAPPAVSLRPGTARASTPPEAQAAPPPRPTPSVQPVSQNPQADGEAFDPTEEKLRRVLLGMRSRS